MILDLHSLRWRRSQRSGNNGQCVEVACIHDPLWRKSTSGNGQNACLEAAQISNAIAVRDSKLDTNGDFPVLSMSREDWTALLAEARTER